MLEEVLDAPPVSGEGVVDADHLVAARDEAIAEVAAEEAGPAGDQAPLHGSGKYPMEEGV
jgi:hypothetical protein